MNERFEIVLIKPDGFPFVESFREVIETVQYGLQALGFTCPVNVNRITPGRTPILFGAHHLAPESRGSLPADSIIYNLEQLLPGYPWYQDHYLDILGRFQVWDYSAASVEQLRRSAIAPRVLHVPIGYAPVLTRISAVEEDVDVLFYGLLTERRQRVLQQLAEAGARVAALNNVWGAERDQWIARARVVLNMHQTDAGRFEIVRATYLLANRKLVVTECNDPEGIDPDLRQGLLAAPYQDLVTTCLNALRNDRLRMAIPQKGFEAIGAPDRAIARILARALDGDDAARPRGAKPPRPQSPNLPAGFGINVFAQFSSPTGLGNTARHTLQAMADAGVPLKAFDFAPYAERIGVNELKAITPHLVQAPEELVHPVNLYFMPAIDVQRILAEVPWLLSQPRFHAAVVWWETTKLHPEWVDNLVRFDAVVAYSAFLAQVLANTLPLTPALLGKQPLFLPEAVGRGRHLFGLPEDATLFIASFDPSSDPTRKNPVAVLHAFRAAFPEQDEREGAVARLVFRINNPNSSAMARNATASLVELCRGDERIHLVLEPMSYERVLSLYASCDAFVSLHRAEGLGLAPLEAMRMGLPVIATGWSGNMSFMDHRSACLVRYRQVQVSGQHPFYRPELLGPDAIWAEPVIEDAIYWMRKLRSDPIFRRDVGESGRRAAAQYHQSALELDWLHELASLWSTHAEQPPVLGKFSALKVSI
jgi:glycosyltransferase involved in cell wall biosynthesis